LDKTGYGEEYGQDFHNCLCKGNYGNPPELGHSRGLAPPVAPPAVAIEVWVQGFDQKDRPVLGHCLLDENDNHNQH